MKVPPPPPGRKTGQSCENINTLIVQILRTKWKIGEIAPQSVTNLHAKHKSLFWTTRQGNVSEQRKY